jgi:predicted ATP-grasp superfamily ATP-dependent carboligase
MRHWDIDDIVGASNIHHPLLFQSYPFDLGILRTDSDHVFESDLLKLLEDTSEKFIYVPIEEDTVSRYLTFKKTYPDANIDALLPDSATFELSRNKFELAKFCRSVGIAVPEVYSAVPSHDKLPLVSKPFKGSGSKGVRYIDSAEELARYDGVVPEGFFFQECIPESKSVIGAFFLFDKGQCVSSYAHRRIRTYPESGGVTVYSESVDNPRVIEIGTRLLKELNWSGFAMVEFLWSDNHDDYVVIEINPRLWGSILLSEMVESNMLSNYVKICNHEPPVPSVDFAHKKLWWFVLDTVLLFKKRQFKTWFNTWMDDDKAIINWTYSNPFRSMAFQLFVALTNKKAAGALR